MVKDNVIGYEPMPKDGEFDRAAFFDYLAELKKQFLFISPSADLRLMDSSFSRFQLLSPENLLGSIMSNPKLQDEYMALMRTFSECLAHLYYAKGWTRKEFIDKTTLSPEEYSRSTRAKKQHTLRYLVTILVALNVGPEVACHLLALQGYTFNMENPVHSAYFNLIVNHAGKDIPECNKILKKQGIPERHFLGAKELPVG